MKFKKGDRVVRNSINNDRTETKFGEAGVITGVISTFDNEERPYVKFDNGVLYHVNEDYYELEEILHSPLYKALS
jgi:hypothetical protein